MSSNMRLFLLICDHLDQAEYRMWSKIDWYTLNVALRYWQIKQMFRKNQKIDDIVIMGRNDPLQL